MDVYSLRKEVILLRNMKQVGMAYMRSLVRNIIMVLFPVISLSSCIREDVYAENVINVGDKLPDFTVSMNNGSVMSGASLRDSVSVVMFFHTGCPDCRQTLPYMQQLYEEYAKQGVLFMLVSRTEEESSIDLFWEENNLTMPYSAQPDRKVYELFARRRVPRIYISGRGGTVRYIFTDNPLPNYDAMSNALDHVRRGDRGSRIK